MQFKGKLSKAIDWVVSNDECAEMDEDVIAYLVSVAMIADLWAVHETVIAAEIVKRRVAANERRAQRKALRQELRDA